MPLATFRSPIFRFSLFVYDVALLSSERILLQYFICRESEQICMAVQATTIETVTVVRPLKVYSSFTFHNYNNANFLLRLEWYC